MPVWVLLGFAALLLAGAGTASAADLITNNGQTTSSNFHNLANHDVAQSFKTGATGATTYGLDSIQVRFNTTPSPTATVTAIVAEGRGAGSTVIATLTNPGSWGTITTFTAPAGTTLASNTTYHLIIDASEGELQATAGNSENTGGASGWSIGDSRYRRSTTTDSGVGGTWASSADALKIRVQGTIIPPSTEARLFSLQVTFGTFSPAFDSDTYVYDVAVGPTISQVTILPIAADGDDATIEYLTDNGNTQADADTTEPDFQRNLLVGNNVTKIKVTAEDGVTTKTYELTIIRQSTNADLSLVEIDGSALTPRFDEDTLTYTKAVPLATTQVTIDAHGKNNQQTIEFLDESDNTLTDQSTTDDDFQLNISEGDNVVKIKVTAGDGVTTKTYTITITPTAPPAVSSVAITSTPANASTYIIGDDIEFTITFDKDLTVAGVQPNRTPAYLTYLTDYAADTAGVDHPEAPCVIGTDTMTLVCTAAVSAGRYDNDGIAIGVNALYDQFAQAYIAGPLNQRANLTHTALAVDSNHKIDGIRPTLSGADADQNDLSKVILTFSEVIKDPVRTKITVKKGGATQTTTGAQIDPVTQRKVTLTLMTALLSTDTDVTVDLAADAVKDLPGNGIAEVLGTSVSVEDTVAPTFDSAQTFTSTVVWVFFDETLDSTSIPGGSAYTVKVEGNSRTPTSANRSVLGTGVLLALGSAIRPGETVTVSYTKPSSNPLKDAADNEVESFTDQPVTNNLAATAPEAPSSLLLADVAVPGQPANEYADRLGLFWNTPWHNGSDITKFQYRYAEGASVPATTTWVDIPDSAPGEQNSNTYVVDGLDPDTQYTFEVRAVNGIGGGDEKAFTDTTLSPNWSFTLRDSSNNDVTELTEGGATATATVSIANNVRFSADQTVQLKWGGLTLGPGDLIQGAGGVSTITILAGQDSGSRIMSSPQRTGATYTPDATLAFTATHGTTVIGSIDLTRVDDEGPPVASITQAPATVNEGGDIEIEVTLSVGYASPGAVRFTVTDADGALSGTLPDREVLNANVTDFTVTLTAAENTTQDDGTRDVTFTLETSTDIPYTLAPPPAVTSVTITVRDDDTPPLAVRNLTAQAGDTEATLSWDAPAAPSPDHGQPVLHYEYRVKVGTGSFGSWTRFPNSDADTRSHTFTGLPNDTLHTYEVAAVNVAGRGAVAQKSVTPIEGVAVSFGAASLSIDEGENAEVTLTLATAPAVGETVTVPLTATPGTGLDSSEYSGVPMNVVFNASETSKSFTVATVDDSDDEPDRLLTLAFGPLPEGYVPGTPATFVLTLVDDDVPIVSATFSRATAEVQEGTSVPVTVSLSQAPEREVVLQIRAARGANLATDEYEGVPADVTFAADATEARFTVQFEDDAVEEGNETLTLTFGTFADSRVTQGANTRLTLTVTDDDGPPAAPDVSVQTGDGFAVLSWPAVSNDSPVLRYEVRWRESDGGTFNAWRSVGLVTSYRVEGLTNGKAHEFEVRAVNAHGNGEEVSSPGTPTERLTGIPKAPQWLRFADVTDSSRAELKWGSPSNGTDRVTANSASATFSQIQGYRIEVCRTTCGDEANWYALVPNTRRFQHKYVHQVLAPGVIRENRYRVQAININGKTGPWSNTATLEATRLERFWLVSPNSSTVDVHLEVWNPDGNPLYVRYTGGGEVRYAQQRLTKKGFPVIGLPVEASTHYRVEVDFVDTFDSPRLQSATVWSLQEGADPYTSPYAKDLLDAEVWRGGQWREAPDTELYLRMGETGKYRVRLKPCGSIYSVIPRRIQAPAGRLRASPTDFDPALFSNLNCKVVQDGWRTDENGDYVLMKDVYDMTNFQDRANDRIPVHAGAPNVWHEVTVTARALEDYDADVRADALLSAPFAVVYNHEVYYGSHDTRSGLVSEGTGLVRISLDRPADAVLPVPDGVTIASDTRVMSWDAVAGASHYLVEWRYGPRYSNRANRDRSHRTATSVTLPLGGSGRGPITARVRAYSSSGVSAWSAELTWDSRAPTLNVLDTAVNEDDGSVGFLVTLDPAATGTVTVNYATADGTAVAGTDYTATSGTLTFAPGEREKKTDLVPIADDDEEDSGETFRLVLSNPTGSDANNGAAVLGDAEAVATILKQRARGGGADRVHAGGRGDERRPDGAGGRLDGALGRAAGVELRHPGGDEPGRGAGERAPCAHGRQDSDAHR